MGYRHIDNLYKNQDILLFKECYALEKVHGTSAHVAFVNGALRFFSGGEKHDNFVRLFDQDALLAAFAARTHGMKFGDGSVTVYGEAYGGKQQGMSHTYGPKLRFIAFEVKIGDEGWLDVETAERVVRSLGLEFVPYERVPATVEALNAERDRPSRVARMCGIEVDRPSEGIVVRPLMEFRKRNGDRIMAKHKRAEFSERASKADTVVSSEKADVLREAVAIANEWVTPMRLEHVLSSLGDVELDLSHIPAVIAAMQEDVERESAGEAVMSREAKKAIGAATVALFKRRVMSAVAQ